MSAELANLYQSQISVSDQSESQRLKVAPEALRNVILKVVGNRTVLNNTDISSLLQQSEQLVQQYQYRRINNVADDLTQPDQLAVVMSFDEKKLNQLLSDLALPIWSKSRPDILIWLITDQVTQPVLSADNTDNPVVDAAIQSADFRGIELILPAMDLQDQVSLDKGNLSQDPLGSVKHASARYAPQVIVTALLSATNSSYQISWQAQLGIEVKQWISRGNMMTAVSDGINQLTDILASQYSQTISQTNLDQSYALIINNVSNFRDYADVTDYLSNLQYVSDLSVDSLNETQLNVTVKIKGNFDVFERTLAISNVIEKDTIQSNSQVLSYTLK